MTGHLLKFSALFVLVMVSFALAFHALFFACDGQGTAGEDSGLDESFGTFIASLLTMFEGALGDFDLKIFKYYISECDRPKWAHPFGIVIMALYLVLTAVVLMNLLIAVLATAHADVHKNAEREFHWARTKMIQDSSKSVAQGRLPPPFNLLGLVVEVLISIFIFVTNQW